ncbi:hypothetical protein NS365_03330 [Aureimonas ureilytica]|uniref:HTH luxR-type domain-containing protein n=1 Tax=Aureimonas ureilytica TaxID=401562 RepID=A0A175RVV7_9HYPH|nr:helix-turn-helix transcriptional regulator [Aureimonas ureilytica]KTR07611.1 hypothetical protein NS365_03330 [Aureimonas ureilytica]
MDAAPNDDQRVAFTRRKVEHRKTFETFQIDEGFARKLRAFGDRYQLTMAELRLVIVLQEGRGLKAAARRIGVGYETVRTQVKSVFIKTGTKRQADVVTLLASFSES